MVFGSIMKHFVKSQVPIIRITGDVDTRTAFLVARSLTKIKPERSKALGLVINSNGGSAVQCDIVLQKIKAYCHEHHLPLYTFAEDQALSVGYSMLAAGDKVYVDKSSACGSIGASITHIGAKQLLERNKVEVRTWVSDEKKVVPPIFYEPKEVHIQAMQKWTDSVRGKMIQHVEESRKGKINVNESEKNDLLYEGKVWSGEETVKYGLADSLGTYGAVFFKEFPESRIVDVSEKPTFDRLTETATTFVKVMSSRALPLIIAYFVIKGTIKVWLLLLILAKKNSSDPKVVKEGLELEMKLAGEDINKTA